MAAMFCTLLNPERGGRGLQGGPNLDKAFICRDAHHVEINEGGVSALPSPGQVQQIAALLHRSWGQQPP